jgi:hypothetical protein
LGLTLQFHATAPRLVGNERRDQRVVYVARVPMVGDGFDDERHAAALAALIAFRNRSATPGVEITTGSPPTIS